MGENSPTPPPDGPGAYVPRRHIVIVKFHDDVPLPYEDGAEEHVRRLAVGPWDQLATEFPGIRLRRAYTSVTPAQIRELVETAVRHNPSYRPHGFLSVFRIVCPSEVDPHALVRALAAWAAVERVYVEPDVVPAGVNAESDPYTKLQSYLKEAPVGIGAQDAWKVTGGDGTGQFGADVEFGWMLGHEDFDGQPISVKAGENSTVPEHVSHGTGVVGIVCASNNQSGSCGIVPKLEEFHLASRLDPAGGMFSISDTILGAAVNLAGAGGGGGGHVLLLEFAVGKKTPGLPVEADEETRKAIQTVTSGGIVVVEPAGDGGADLDSFKEQSTGKLILSRYSSDFFNSGAIVVGAALDAENHPRAPWSCYGSRVDCYAQGELITTCKPYGPGATEVDRYTHTFGGTSGAAAIIAGAVLSIQGMAQVKLQKRLSPTTVQALLRNPLLSTPSEKGFADQIGRMPNLKAIADALKPPEVKLLTSTVTFFAIWPFPLPPVWKAAVFEVTAVESFTATFELTTPPPLGSPFATTILGTEAKATSIGAEPAKARLWFEFRSPFLGEDVTQEVSVLWKEMGVEFKVVLSYKARNVPFLRTVLVLDRSGSMLGLAGTGITKIEALRQAASSFAALVPFSVDESGTVYPGNELGAVGFATQAALFQPMTLLTDPTARLEFANSLKAIEVHPGGQTAIGLGLREAMKMLKAPPPTDYSDYPWEKSILVFTDGLENVEPKIAKVMGEEGFDNNTKVYAVGLGTPAQVSTESLAALTNATGGYSLLTGALDEDTEDYFRVSKYFLQVLFDMTGQEMGTDPEGVLFPGQTVRVPFVVSEADVQAQVVLLTDIPVVQLEVETPAGTLLDPAAPGVSFGQGPYVRFCRVALPQGKAHAGTWHARLTLDMACLTVDMNSAARVGRDPAHAQSRVDDSADAQSRIRTAGVRYSVTASVRSGLCLKGAMAQGSLRPGEPLRAQVTLTEYGLPVESRATVQGRVRSPDGRAVTVPLAETGPGVFELSFPTVLPGAYEVRLLASGRTFGGTPFTRERVMTGAVLTESDRLLALDASRDACCGETQRQLRVLVWLGWTAVFLLLLLLVVALLVS